MSILFASIIGKGYTAFQQTYVQLDVFIDPDVVSDSPNTADYSGLIKKSVYKMFPEVKGRRDKRALNKLFSSGAAYQLRKMVLENRDIIGKTLSVWVPADDDIDMLIKGHIDRNVPEGERRLSDKQLSWVDRLIAENKIKKQFNTNFFTSGDSREPELAGVWGATIGSFYTLIITLLLSFPIGVAAAIYLEEFATQNKLRIF